MNMNKKIVASVLVGTLGLTTVLGVNHFTADATASTYKNVLTNESYSQILNEKSTTNSVANVAGEGIEKDETVFVKADATGDVKQVIVSDWLKNYSNQDTITDKTNLTDIVNVKGDETFTQGENGEITWDAKGGDIYYQGTTDKELPVSVQAKYTLDGQEIQPEELKGKSGQLTIEYTYENTSKVEGTDLYTPFTVVASTMLKTDNFANVKAENAKVISDGNKFVVVGVAMPGMKESLDLGDDTKVPGSITITADVTDYEPITTLNIVTADLLNQLNLDDTDQLADLGKSIDDLSDASNKLVDGTNTLSDKLGELKSNTVEYTDAVKTLTSNLDKYVSGVNKVTSGVKQLYGKTGELTKGVSGIASGAKTLNDGLNQVKTGVDSIATNLDSLASGAGQIKTGADSLNTALQQLEAGKKQENAAYAKLSETVANNEKIIAALKQAGVDAQIVGMLEQNTAGQKQIAQALTKSGATIEGGLTQAANGTSKLSTAATTLSAGATKMKSGAKTLQGALSKLTGGSKSLLDGANKLNAASGTLGSGIKQLYDGSVQLGQAGSQITQAIPKLNSASNKFVDAVGKLNDGGKTLAENMGKFDREGIDKLTDTIDGSLGNAIEKFDDLQEAADKYTIFTDSNSDIKSNVKFVIELN